MDGSSVSGAPRVDGMPTFGLGTWQNDDPETCAETVERALRMGYRHIDTAQAYGNEGLVGEGIERSDVDRDEIFLATKIWNSDLGGDEAIAAAHDAVDNLGVDGVDLLYVHWPAGAYDPVETFRAFDELVEQGVTERIGISNFEPEQIETAVATAEHDIFAHQFECHPMLQQEAVRSATEEQGIEPVAYSPLARGEVFGQKPISAIADAHDVSEAQVSLAWLRERGVTAIPKASSEAHLRDNWSSVALELDADELARIDALDAERRMVDPEFGPWNQ